MLKEVVATYSFRLSFAPRIAASFDIRGELDIRMRCGNSARQALRIAKLVIGIAAITFITTPVHADFSLEDDGISLVVMEDGRPVLRYVDREPSIVDASLPIPHVSYIHPLYDPAGRSITGSHETNRDEVSGVFWCWSACIVDGEPVDICGGGAGRKVFERRLIEVIASDRVVIETQHAWICAESGEAFALETTRISVHPAQSIARAIDLDITIRNVSKAQISLTSGGVDDRSGLFIRTNPERRPSLTAIVNTSDELGSGKGSWGDVSARIPRSSRYTGVAIMSHPDNPDTAFPAWSLSDEGTLNAAWPQSEPIVLESGEHIQVKYRLYVHLGSGINLDIDAAFTEYAQTDD